MAREKDRHHLVAQLAVAHALAGVLVTRGHQHGEEVACILTGTPPCRDHLVHDAVEGGERSTQPAVGRCGDPLRDVDDTSDRSVGGAQRHRQGLADPVDLAADVGAQQRFSHDPEGELRHLRREIHDGVVARIPPLGQGLGRGGDRVRKPRDPVTVEGWLGDASLSEPRVSLVRQEAVRQKCPEHLEPRGLLAVVPVVVLKDVPHVIGSGEDHDVAMQHPEVHDLTVVINRVEQEADRIATHARQAAEPAPGARTRWEAVSHGLGETVCTRRGRRTVYTSLISTRGAATGSTRSARRVGTYPAASATSDRKWA